LRAVIARGPVAPARVQAMALEIVSALGAAHAAGVIHRDLKPENVLITSNGGIKIVDFGIAQIEGAEATRLTRAGAMLGTPAYMAPEQLLGGSVDARADLYAVGVVLSEMLTGHHPLRSGGSPAPDGPLGAIIARCMRGDPAARYANARELEEALAGVAAGTDGPAEAGPANAGHYVRTAGHDQRGSRFWWEFHEAMAALVYWAMAVPAWYARGLIGGWQGRTFFIVFLAAVVVAATSRLHLWFTSRSYPAELAWVHRRSSIWIRIADWVFALTLAIGGILIRDEHSPLTMVMPSVAIGAVVAFLLIEPGTARDAFKRTGIARSGKVEEVEEVEKVRAKSKST
jgi:hypothetical protein